MIKAIILVCLFTAATCEVFDYSDQANWGGLCQDGMHQSPIDIDPQNVRMCPDWGYEKITFACEDFVENIDPEWNDYAQMNIGDAFIFYYHELENWYEAYRAHSLYWHTMSEHKINGVQADAELEIFFEPVSWTDLPAEAMGMYVAWTFQP